ncbi:MAG: 2-isopropylmalate synthase [Chloroflexi bacterium]|nr:2-isopropylmalate synthase [Chloroflexota bacterium]
MSQFQPRRPQPRLDVHDVDAPNLVRSVFPYEDVPHVLFEKSEVPLSPAPELWITDTTFRDGQQAREPYTVEQIVHLYDLLHKLDGGSGLIRQCEFFLYTEKDRTALEAVLARGYRYPKVTGWIRAVKSDFQLVRAAGLKETGILTSCSDYHIFNKLGMRRPDALRFYLEIVDAALDAGVKPRCHFEDLTRADVYGFALPFAQALMERASASGVPIKIRLCDTMGVGLPWPSATLPRGVPKLVRAFVDEAGVPPQQLEWHGHNDLFKVHANSVAAWLYGCSAINATLLSTGERTGNSPLEAAVMEYIGLVGPTEQRALIDTRVLTEIVGYMRDVCGVPVPANYPLLGSEFNVTRAGIHADGLLKDEEIYNVFDTRKLLRRPVGVGINDKSGTAGVTFWVNEQLGLDREPTASSVQAPATGSFRAPSRQAGQARIDKHDPRIVAMHQAIQRQYDAGRASNMTQDELLALAQEYLPDLFGGGPDR